MGSIHKHMPIKNSIPQPPLPITTTTDNGFPILAIAVLCIIGTAFLLVTYYIFLTKRCLNWQQLDPLRRFSISRVRRNEDPLMAYSPSFQSHGLDELLIREIPTFQYTRCEGEDTTSMQHKCVICFNEFQEQELLRVLPGCAHSFHLDCIDIWFQSNDNCPLCRSSVSGITRNQIDQIVAPTSSPQDSHPVLDTHLGGDEDFVVIELGDTNDRKQERNESQTQRIGKVVKQRKLHHVSNSIMGDECIDVRREKEEQFLIQPIRRSFSMDSAADPNVFLAVQEIIRQNGHFSSEIRNSEECSSSSSSSGRVMRRSFFPFGHGRGSKSSVLPIEF